MAAGIPSYRSQCGEKWNFEGRATGWILLIDGLDRRKEKGDSGLVSGLRLSAEAEMAQGLEEGPLLPLPHPIVLVLAALRLLS